jgi:type IV pilus assembly protein PilB
VEGICAQRLVRRICANCKTAYEPNEVQLKELRLTEEDIQGKKFYYGRGCSRCNGTGYKGRVGVFEIMTFDDEIRDLIMNRASTNVLRVAAMKKGMVPLARTACLPSSDGITTLDEVVKETITEG